MFIVSQARQQGQGGGRGGVGGGILCSCMATIIAHRWHVGRGRGQVAPGGEGGQGTGGAIYATRAGGLTKDGLRTTPPAIRPAHRCRSHMSMPVMYIIITPSMIPATYGPLAIPTSRVAHRIITITT